MKSRLACFDMPLRSPPITICRRGSASILAVFIDRSGVLLNLRARFLGARARLERFFSISERVALLCCSLCVSELSLVAELLLFFWLTLILLNIPVYSF